MTDMEKVYISYCWREPSNGVTVNWLYPSLKSAGFECVLDKEDCRLNDDIIEFEKEIGKGAHVVAVIGKDYLFSLGCMFEIASVLKNGKHKERLRIVCLDDFDRNDDFYQQVVDYWDKESLKKKDTADKMGAPANQVLLEEFNRLGLIHKNLSNLWKSLRNTNTLNFLTISQDNFGKLIQSLNEGRVSAKMDVFNPELNEDAPAVKDEIMGGLNIPSISSKRSSLIWRI